jgi:hypothetical protein
VAGFVGVGFGVGVVAGGVGLGVGDAAMTSGDGTDAGELATSELPAALSGGLREFWLSTPALAAAELATPVPASLVLAAGEPTAEVDPADDG